MKVILKPIKGFEVTTENGDSLGTFLKTGEWNGMLELKKDGDILIIESGTYHSLMRDLFSCDDEQTVDVIKASPNLHQQLTKE